MGGSHGGSTTLNAMVAKEKSAGFAAAVSLYPACGVQIGGWYGSRGVYRPAAHHAFDGDRPERYVATRINMNAPNRRGATTGGNAQAWVDSIREVEAFFEQHLK